MRSLATRLAAAFCLIVAGAIAVVYIGAVPRLEQSLKDEELRGLAAAARRHVPPIEDAIGSNADLRSLNVTVRDAADAANARVTVLGVTSGTAGLQTYLKSDSFREAQIRDLGFEVALEAAKDGRLTTGTEPGSSGRIGEAAVPLFFVSGRQRRLGSVVVFSAPLGDSSADVDLVRDRILVAGLLALLFATAMGYLVAGRIAARIARLEQVSRRVARGDFDVRFPPGRDDELGQLARALDDMRGQLAELDHARSRFIATASHELRTPVFSLGGFLELLEDDDVPEEDRKRFLEQIRAQVERLGKLATDLLDLSRLEAGAVDLQAERTDLGAVARTVTSEFGPALAAHDSKLEVRLPTEPIELVCDPDRVAQIMRILIDNALTHTPPGTNLVVSAGRRDGVARMGVGDFGPGIPRTMLPRIFEPFATSDDAQGSGLGLAIAHELAERMDGRIVVESQPGRTTFTLEIPS